MLRQKLKVVKNASGLSCNAVQHRSNKSIITKDQYNSCFNFNLLVVLFGTAGMGTTRGEDTQGDYCSRDLPVVLY